VRDKNSEDIQNVKMVSFLHFFFYMAIISGVIRGLSQNLAERGPLDTVRGPLANNKKKREIMVNPVVDGYTKTMDVEKNFSRGGLGDFFNIFPRGTKRGEICFSYSKPRKQPFYAKNFKIQADLCPRRPPFQHP